MAKKNVKKPKAKQDIQKQITKNDEVSPEVERIYKILLRVMSWVVGICFVLVVILPEFNKPLLDKITRILFYIGIINLLVFIIIEFVGNSLKSVISKLISD